ncbi:MAG TPA: Flp pilus assembly protein CpaB [Rhizomicrobium sp.]|jgi:pilus assembly protein CpaB|nr:Flp pilus assembly protein CpaB [Rhizomicrobium sp.]
MDRSRIIVLVIAAVAAGAVALLARSVLGGGTPSTAAAPGPHIVMSEVLVAASQLTPGSALTPASVRWQDWPSTSVDPSFITHNAAPDLSKIVAGAVVRAPMMAGEPVTTTKIVHADTAGFLASQLMPGMRAVSIPISADTGAGGFILPNDRVDVICTVTQQDSHRVESGTILKDVRVLAVDQTSQDSKDTKSVVARTATLELSPDQVELVERAKVAGTLSLALRALGDSESADAKTVSPQQSSSQEINIVRYGISRPIAVVGTKE